MTYGTRLTDEENMEAKKYGMKIACTPPSSTEPKSSNQQNAQCTQTHTYTYGVETECDFMQSHFVAARSFANPEL